MNRRPRPLARPARALPAPRVFEAIVESVGARGDGMARIGDETVFIPLTAPGDKVVGRIEGKRGDGYFASLSQILGKAPGRVDPPCPHFGRCGGCALQHWNAEDYGAWKRQLVVDAIRRAGLPVEAVRPLVSVPPGTRRRATFAFARRAGEIVLGFNERASHRVADIDRCLLLEPSLSALFSPLRRLLGELGGEGEGALSVTLTETGIDLLIEGGARLDLFDRERLAAFAVSRDLARLSWRRSGAAEPVAARRIPLVRFAGVPVVPPPGAFLQPSIGGERALADLVFDAVGGAHRVADLFAGLGSFTFPLAQKAQVFAIEGDGEAARALAGAARESRSRVTTAARDLFKAPLAGSELAGFDAVVFDPPRAGAMAQAEALAANGPPIVVAVSCNPATLSRDARSLAGGGYRLVAATPLDQFPWSPHVEAVAVFQR